MTKKIKYIICAFLLTSICMVAQDKKVNKATQQFENYSYSNAIESYESLVEKGYSDQQIFSNLGDSNYQIANYDEAANWFEKLFALNDAQIDADYMYRYAQSLKSAKKYEAAADWMGKYRTAKTAEVRAKKIAKNPDYLEQIEEQSGRYDLKNLPINSAAADFAPAFKGEEVVFSTARDTGVVSKFIHTWNEKPFTNLYRARQSEN